MARANPDACAAWHLLVEFLLSQRTHLPTLAAALELSPTQCHVLHLIEPGQAMPMSRLARTLSCDASNVTGLVDRLEREGLIERQSSPEDRRVKVLALTPAGSRLRSELLRRVTDRPQPLARLTPEERKALVRILEKLFDQHVETSD